MYQFSIGALYQFTSGGDKRLGTVLVDAWSAVTKAGLREEIAQVRTREELAATIMRAARIAGYTAIPIGWLALTAETKTVIGIKSGAVVASLTEGLLA